LEQVGRKLTASVKQRFVPKELERTQRDYVARLAHLKAPPDGPKANGGSNGLTEGAVLADRTACRS
jgi:hypothetical protein